VKYWGKRHEELILPINSSISGTLHQQDLKSVTTIMVDEKFDKDRMWLNGVEEDINNKRLQQCLKQIRQRILSKVDKNGKHISRDKLQSLKIRICSENNFPTASGLASSASGFACLVYTLTQLFEIPENYPGEFSGIARMGSGSACRSLYGGFVKWEQGIQENGQDSIAVQIVPEDYWPLKVLILVVSQKKKDVSSTSGMETSVKTSDLLRFRKQNIVPERISRIETAIKERDFETFGIETMKDSNQFHAVCADTYPPIFYMNDISKNIIHLITKYNTISKQIKAAYTFDAGPNAVIYTPPQNYDEVLALINHYFPITSAPLSSYKLPSQLENLIPKFEDVLQGIISTKVGPGPQRLSDDYSLIDPLTGEIVRSKL